MERKEGLVKLTPTETQSATVTTWDEAENIIAAVDTILAMAGLRTYTLLCNRLAELAGECVRLQAKVDEDKRDYECLLLDVRP